jgi:hypothetical protein
MRNMMVGIERELKRHRWAQNRGWEVSNRQSSPPPPFSYQHR